MSRAGLPKISWTKLGVTSPAPDVTPAVGGAKATLTQIRQQHPPLLRGGQTTSWAQGFDQREAAQEQKEAEAALASRQEQLQALDDETTVRRLNRRIAIGFGAAGMGLLKTLQTTAKLLEDRVSLKGSDMSMKEIRDTIQVLGATILKSQAAMEAAARTERFMVRKPLDSGEGEPDDLADMNEEGAMLILNNLAKSLGNLTRKSHIIPAEGELVSEKIPTPEIL